MSTVPSENDATSPSALSTASIATQAVNGSIVSVAASLVTLVLGSVRMVLLTRFLLPEDVGISAQALLLLNFAVQFQQMGLNNALIHHQQTSEKVLTTFFTMRMGLLVATLALLAALTPLIARLYPDMPLLVPVLLAYIATEVIRTLNNVQTTILAKEMAFHRLSTADVASSLSMTLVAPYLAWQGWGVWALVAEQVAGVVPRLFLVQRWRPRIGWDRQEAQWLWNFGKSMWAGSSFTYLIDNFDDFWVGAVLGRTPLGLYARAYEFARYPRRLIANPILSVFLPTFARLQEEPERLSRAFFRATSLMARVSGWLSLVFILGARDLITLIGPQWLAMVPTFQLMIVYTLFDPISTGTANLLSATGYPHWIMRARLAQAILFLPTVVLLGGLLGISGVALAANLMVILGTVILLVYSRRIVTFSLRALLLWPSIAILVTGGSVILLNPLWREMAPWASLLGKSIFITLLYGTLLWLTEREQLRAGWQMIWGLARPRLTLLLSRAR